jgi:ABC-type multidrug transport system fused ATPase/permease subunit
MKTGRLVEQGAHRELLENNSIHARLDVSAVAG